MKSDDLERRRLAADLRLKRAELDLKRREIEAKLKHDKLTNWLGTSPLAVAIIAGAVSIIGGGVANYVQARNNLELERQDDFNGRQ